MEVKAKDTVISVTIEASPEELDDLDDEFNRIYKIVTANGNEQFRKIWELKDKLNIAIKG